MERQPTAAGSLSFLLSFELLLGTLAFLFPFVLGGPQWLVGTGVNFLLFTAARRNLPGRYLWPIIVLPSLAALSRGFLFGPFTPFLIYFLPFIWLGNFLLVVVYQGLAHRGSPVGGVVVAALLKALFLFLFAQFYFRSYLVPALFLQSMGVLQFLTALSGGFLALKTTPQWMKPNS